MRAFATEVYSLYRSNFRAFYKLSAPPALFAVFLYTVRQVLTSALAARLPRGIELLAHPWFIVAMGAVNFAVFFVAWLFEAFVLAAVSETVRSLRDGRGIPEGDGYVRARERFASIAYVSFATYWRFAIAFVVTTYFVMPAIIRLAPRQLVTNWWFSFSVGILILLLILAALIGYALAIPIVVSTGVGAREALRASWRLTDGHELKLMLFVVESLVGGIAVAYASSWLAYFIFQHVTAPAWADWAVPVITALGTAAAQTPMLVAFALLYFQIAESAETVARAAQA